MSQKYQKSTEIINKNNDTIAAIATSSGKGGVGVIRISGFFLESLIREILGFVPIPRKATFCSFKNKEEILDEGIAIYFEAPHSFTGEEVLELQGHGGPVLLDYILSSILEKGVRIARPGEFSERAFLNNKIDLIQAESIADLINAQSVKSVKSAMRSLRGEFSKHIYEFLDKLINLRIVVEACIDFPEEDIENIKLFKIKKNISLLLDIIKSIRNKANQGVLLQEGMHIVIAGEPNVGKSTLLNKLTGEDIAIVTDVAGTTRDVLRGCIDIDGIPVHISDTAGLRETADRVEQEGIKRAYKAITDADLILFVLDATKKEGLEKSICDFIENLDNKKIYNPFLVLVNKMDLKKIDLKKNNYKIKNDIIYLSAKNGEGIDTLKNFLKKFMGLDQNQEGVFIARRRHIEALTQTAASLESAVALIDSRGALELVAEELRLAQWACNTITGAFTSDDLLGRIFSTFCLGK